MRQSQAFLPQGLLSQSDEPESDYDGNIFPETWPVDTWEAAGEDIVIGQLASQEIDEEWHSAQWAQFEYEYTGGVHSYITTLDMYPDENSENM